MANLKAARGGILSKQEVYQSLDAVWPDALQIGNDARFSLGCDSLEVMSLSAAANEMFHLYEANIEESLLSAETFGDWLDIIEAAWSSGVTRVTFMTSGSTGPPKKCTHEWSHLQVEIDYLAAIFATHRRIIAMAPAHHIYGFIFTAMLADKLDIEVVPADRASPGELARDLRQGDLIVSIPDRWQWLDQTLATWPKGINGVVSTAPCPLKLKRSLIQKGLSGITEVYGSSETSGIAIRTSTGDAYRLMPHWTRWNAVDLEPTVLVHLSGVQYRIMDRIDFREDGTFLLAGRQDGAVQVGGTNVYPARIAALLLARPGVAQTAVRLMRPDEGVRLKAFIVPSSKSRCDDVRHELEVWMGTSLLAVERPKSLKFGPSLPTNLLGKSVDW